MVRSVAEALRSADRRCSALGASERLTGVPQEVLWRICCTQKNEPIVKRRFKGWWRALKFAPYALGLVGIVLSVVSLMKTGGGTAPWEDGDGTSESRAACYNAANASYCWPSPPLGSECAWHTIERSSDREAPELLVRGLWWTSAVDTAVFLALELALLVLLCETLCCCWCLRKGAKSGALELYKWIETAGFVVTPPVVIFYFIMVGFYADWKRSFSVRSHITHTAGTDLFAEPCATFVSDTCRRLGVFTRN